MCDACREVGFCGVLACGPGSLSQVEIGTTVVSGLHMVGKECGELGRVRRFEVRQTEVSIAGSKLHMFLKKIQTSISSSLQWRYHAVVFKP